MDLSVLTGSPASLFSETDEVILKPVTAEDISESASVTSHAVEDGGDISDHVEPQSNKLSLSTVFARNMNVVSALVSSDKSPEKKIKMLTTWKTNGELLTYSGPVFKGIRFFKQGIDITMKNLVITSVSFKRSSDSGGGFMCQIGLEQLRIAYAKEVTVTLPAAAQSTNKKGPSETSTGSKPKKKKSILSFWTSE